ncbi:hypothetical protein Ahy_A06g030449 [Arachis hypogaea]|uniref:Uncharacterized protein n=1 Tax=Arachis hypogaea TaxID=3818 RepID=A0A445CW99_ARAHY|nr:hypothetical protein Ahy_A06g030449 [Arachis hypogaea]
MIGTGSHIARSSNWLSLTKNWTRSTTRSRHRWVPEWCGCGCRFVLRWSTTETHPNKPFFIVLTIMCGLFVWANCVQEELAEKVVPGDDDGKMKMNFAWRLNKIEADFRNLKFMIQALGFGFLVLVVFV